MSEIKKETLEEVAARHFNKEDLVEGVNIQYVLQCAFIQGAKWQAERMYSEKEMLAIIAEIFHTPKLRDGGWEDIFEWFEQFKK